MNRRDTARAWFALVAAHAPFASLAQQRQRPWRVGVVWAGTRLSSKANGEAFLAGMKDHGYELGRNLIVDARYAEGDAARNRVIVDEVIALEPDVLVGANTVAALAMKSATSSIPIVMGTSGDPVGDGLVQSLARPGGNVTGNSLQVVELGAKHIEILVDLLPHMRRVALLMDRSGVRLQHDSYERLASASATAKGLALEVHRADNLEEIRQALRLMQAQRADAVAIYLSPRFNAMRPEIAQSAANARLPSIAFDDQYAQDGGLMSYGPSFIEAMRRAAYFVDRILKGAKPADLPIEQPTKFTLVINARTAKALGIKIPGLILLRADRVIE